MSQDNELPPRVREAQPLLGGKNGCSGWGAIGVALLITLGVYLYNQLPLQFELPPSPDQVKQAQSTAKQWSSLGPWRLIGVTYDFHGKPTTKQTLPLNGITLVIRNGRAKPMVHSLYIRADHPDFQRFVGKIPGEPLVLYYNPAAKNTARISDHLTLTQSNSAK